MGQRKPVSQRVAGLGRDLETRASIFISAHILKKATSLGVCPLPCTHRKPVAILCPYT